MYAILTTYHGKTAFRDARIVASADGDKPQHRVTVAYEPKLTLEQNHANAAISLALKLQWQGELIAGKTHKGFVFVRGDGTRYFIPA
jgi:hypothetical protein